MRTTRMLAGLLAVVFLLCAAGWTACAETAGDGSPELELKQVVVLSRHNIRAPLAGPGSVLDTVTPHSWIQFSADPGELTARGGAMETIMGIWFRNWLLSEGLLPNNYRPEEGEVRFYSNAYQRTIATSRFFAAGFLPAADVDIETHADFGRMDPTYHVKLTYYSEAYRNAVEEEIARIYGVADISRIGETLKDAYAFLEDVIDLKDSAAYADGSVTGFAADDDAFTWTLGASPSVEGSLKLGCQIADALVLQYYEEADDAKAGFGTAVSEEEMRLISEIKDTYVDALYAAPLIAVNVANPLLKEIAGELNTDGRVFTFLCGHDSNLASVLSALDCKPEQTVGSIEPSVPIGSKIVFEKWADPEGKLYARMRMIYPSAAQLRSLTLLDEDHPPMILTLEFSDLAADENGFYPYEELMNRFEKLFAAYDSLPEIYGEDLEEAA